MLKLKINITLNNNNKKKKLNFLKSLLYFFFLFYKFNFFLQFHVNLSTFILKNK